MDFYLILFKLLVPDLPPSNITSIAGDPWSLLVNWNLVPKGYENGVVTKYGLFYSELNSKEVTNKTFPATKLNTMITGLKDWTPYKLELMAFTRIGVGPKVVVLSRTRENGKSR